MDDYLGMYFFVLVTVAAFSFAVTSEQTKSSLASDCDNFGAFMVDDVKYECRRAEK